jgi:hypothetical protein
MNAIAVKTARRHKKRLVGYDGFKKRRDTCPSINGSVNRDALYQEILHQMIR